MPKGEFFLSGPLVLKATSPLKLQWGVQPAAHLRAEYKASSSGFFLDCNERLAMLPSLLYMCDPVVGIHIWGLGSGRPSKA